MKVNFAHLKERATSGGWVNFAVFDARSASGSTSANSTLLSQLTLRAKAAGLKIDQSALVFSQQGKIRFYGDENLVNYLSKSGLPNWTHNIDV